MAFSFFKQSDIETMDINDIPEEFINYFDSLDEAGKISLVGGRKDLAEALGFHPEISLEDENNSIKQNSNARNIANIKEQIVESAGSESSDVYSDEDELLDDLSSFDDLDLDRIRKNVYEGKNIEKCIKDNMSPFEVLAIGDNDTQCMLHHTQLKEKNIKFRVPNHPVFGVNVKLCKQCKRIFIEESKMGYLDMQLMNRNIPHTFYNLETTKKYLQTLIKPYSFTEDNGLFFQKTWVEENPTCVCTTDYPRLHMIPCEKEYKGRKVSFTGYQCALCKRIYVRRSKALEIEDECSKLGIPRIRRFKIERKIPGKKAIPADQLHPDYYVENGRRIKYRSEYRHKIYRLNEDDTLVVSDIKSCMLDGHGTKTVIGLMSLL